MVRGFPVRSSNRTCGFPASGSRTSVTTRHAPALVTPARPCCPAPLGVVGPSAELPGCRQSPGPTLVEARLEPGLLPSPPVSSGGSMRYYEPLRLPTWLHPEGELRRPPPRPVGSPVLPCVLCRRATPLTPASESRLVGRVLPWTPAAFPVIQAGRPSRRHFRGLLRLHAGTHCIPGAMGARPVDLPTHPWWALVPRASTSRLPF
jgi:hypothetical protein